jgi:hypothetical protein
MAGLAKPIVTPGIKLNTVCSRSKPTRAAGHELQKLLPHVAGADGLLSICNMLLQFPDDVWRYHCSWLSHSCPPASVAEPFARQSA